MKDNPLLPEILAAQRADILESWELADHYAQRERCWERLHTLTEFGETLGAVLDRILRDDPTTEHKDIDNREV